MFVTKLSFVNDVINPIDVGIVPRIDFIDKSMLVTIVVDGVQATPVQLHSAVIGDPLEHFQPLNPVVVPKLVDVARSQVNDC